ncbi:hypothetical protein HDU98_001563 [Podochytrium sp. JEL0797]|nr:hypothetical protein HDU98_001563 [Podochytrium sp. JEL0797]
MDNPHIKTGRLRLRISSPSSSQPAASTWQRVSLTLDLHTNTLAISAANPLATTPALTTPTHSTTPTPPTLSITPTCIHTATTPSASNAPMPTLLIHHQTKGTKSPLFVRHHVPEKIASWKKALEDSISKTPPKPQHHYHYHFANSSLQHPPTEPLSPRESLSPPAPLPDPPTQHHNKPSVSFPSPPPLPIKPKRPAKLTKKRPFSYHKVIKNLAIIVEDCEPSSTSLSSTTSSSLFAHDSDCHDDNNAPPPHFRDRVIQSQRISHHLSQNVALRKLNTQLEESNALNSKLMKKLDIAREDAVFHIRVAEDSKRRLKVAEERIVGVNVRKEGREVDGEVRELRERLRGALEREEGMVKRVEGLVGREEGLVERVRELEGQLGMQLEMQREKVQGTQERFSQHDVDRIVAEQVNAWRCEVARLKREVMNMVPMEEVQDMIEAAEKEIQNDFLAAQKESMKKQVESAGENVAFPRSDAAYDDLLVRFQNLSKRHSELEASCVALKKSHDNELHAHKTLAKLIREQIVPMVSTSHFSSPHDLKRQDSISFGSPPCGPPPTSPMQRRLFDGPSPILHGHHHHPTRMFPTRSPTTNHFFLHPPPSNAHHHGGPNGTASTSASPFQPFTNRSRLGTPASLADSVEEGSCASRVSLGWREEVLDMLLDPEVSVLLHDDEEEVGRFGGVVGYDSDESDEETEDMDSRRR